MSIRLLRQFLRNGKSLLFADRRYNYQFRTVQRIAFKKTLNQQSILAVHNGSIKNEDSKIRHSFVNNVLNRVTSPQSSVLRSEVTKRLAFGDSLPFLSLIGCNLASGNVLITKEDELESVLWEIRDAMNKQQRKFEKNIVADDDLLAKNLKLSDFNVGPPLAKGCSAVVYAANLKQEDASSKATGANKTETLQAHAQNSSNCAPVSACIKKNVDPKNHNLLQVQDLQGDESLFSYPWALKMMFNYDIQSNACAIVKAMFKETVPARRGTIVSNDWEVHIKKQTLELPPHPNVVFMPTYFCDNIPDQLEDSKQLFPMALPARFGGYGRNMSLFILMKRYNCSLRDYLVLQKNALNIRTKIILFAQLLEAIVHINNHQIAHRDLKSDNILIDTITDSLPVLVLSDFGCCLADKNYGLKIPYQSDEIDKGGNVQLMSPEIILKQPSVFSVLDYTKSDLWAAGTIAYEIFGFSNPFYNDAGSGSFALRNVDYQESMLPELSDDIPVAVRRLIENVLQRNPRKRLDCDIAANVLELYLWAPSSWVNFYKRMPSDNEILEWLLNLTTKILCERGLGFTSNSFTAGNRRTYTEYVLISTFLSRAKLKKIRKALNWIHSV